MTDFALDAYFTRVSYRGPRDTTREVLASLHLHHATTIPFENLDPLLGRPVRLDAAAVAEKLVRCRRGGYCFEQNGLFAHVLDALGFHVTRLAARVRFRLPEGAPQTPLSHMLMKVDLPDGPFLCDVGFGGQSPTAPLRLEAELEQTTPHGTYRLRTRSVGYELEMRTAEGWSALYRFTEEPQSTRDYEVYNWYTSTHPDSFFTYSLVAARVNGRCRVGLFNSELSVHHPDGRKEQRTLTTAGQAHEVLADEFDIEIERSEIERVWPQLLKP
jgi:N-hydroxyarylamine O-acetyltransferase